MPVRVLIVDDDALVRSGLSMMLAAFVMSAKRHSKSFVRNPEGARG